MSSCLTLVSRCIACSVTTPTDCADCQDGYTLDNRGACSSNAIVPGSNAATLEMLMITLMVIVLTIMCTVF